MYILQVANTYFPELQFGGPPQKIHSLSQGLLQRGHQVRVVSFDSKRPHACGERTVDGVVVQYLPWIGRGLRQCPTNWTRLAALIREADIIHLYGLYNLLCPLAARMARQHARPFILEPLGMYPARARNVFVKGLYNRCCTRAMARHCAALVAASAGELQELRPLAPNGRVVLRRNGIDVSAFQNLPSRMEFRSQHGLEDATRVVLYLGRISPIKNLEQLILAFHQVALPDAILFLVGPGDEPDYRTQLKRLVQEKGLRDRVRFPGPLFGRDKLAALAAADLFVLPSLSESFGNAAAEAVVAGVPVLLTESCGIAALIHQRAGLAVPLGVGSLAKGLTVMLDAAQRERLTARRGQVLQELSWEEPLKQTEDLYAEILGKRPAQSSAQLERA